ncbi:MAG: hypothetical protein ABI690_11255 [Chloroflexota bacterium]
MAKVLFKKYVAWCGRIVYCIHQQIKGDSVFYKNVQDALAYLESCKPGLTAGVDWNRIIFS